MKIHKYEDLDIWKLSIEISLLIYKCTSNQAFRKDYGLSDQVRRAIVSVSSNIAEGFERSNNNEFIHFLKIAKGSAGEVRSQLFIASKLKYISLSEFTYLSDKLIILSSQLGKFITYLSQKRKNDQFLTR